MTIGTSTSAILLLATVALAGGPALAQSRNSPPQQPPQTAPLPPQSAPSEKQSAPSEGSSAAPDQGEPGTLSHDLSRSQGVIEPPATQDRGVVAPPSAGPQSTPVIPPPGSPGGNPRVQPK